ncbi:hypothetical protein ACIBTV_28830 [Micromonospora sp. NPDC049366]
MSAGSDTGPASLAIASGSGPVTGGDRIIGQLNRPTGGHERSEERS